MKKSIFIALFALVLGGIFAACNTYQRCPAYTDNVSVEMPTERV